MDAQVFARRVALKAQDDRGGSYPQVWIGVINQLLLVA